MNKHTHRLIKLWTLVARYLRIPWYRFPLQQPQGEADWMYGWMRVRHKLVHKVNAKQSEAKQQQYWWWWRGWRFPFRCGLLCSVFLSWMMSGYFQSRVRTQTQKELHAASAVKYYYYDYYYYWAHLVFGSYSWRPASKFPCMHEAWNWASSCDLNEFCDYCYLDFWFWTGT